MIPAPPEIVQYLISRSSPRRDAREDRSLIAAFLVALLIHVGLSFLSLGKGEPELAADARSKQAAINLHQYRIPPPKTEAAPLVKRKPDKRRPIPVPEIPDRLIQPLHEPVEVASNLDVEMFEPELLLGTPEPPPATDGVLPEELADLTLPVRIQHVRAVFPEEARQARAEGRVILSAVVSRDGEVNSVEVLWAPDPDLGFSQAAIAAIHQWQYRPGLYQGKPVAVRINIQVDFYLV